ncbi:restriction endonuclease subunit S [Gluconobacter sphaericus]|nr:restriction endonuclease subunit S [Gluconobacter sphaericus]MBF0886821.1 DNA polymerase beta domain-containing protein region [Gluconobacter sphaericus]
MDIISAPFNDLLSFVVDNRGRTCPTSEIGFPLIATNCVSNQALYPSKENVRYVDKNTYNEWFRAHPKPNDILFVLKGSPGRCALVPDPVDFCIAQDMVALRANKQKVDPNYLFAALRSPLIQDAIDRMHVGTMIPHFKKSDFSKLSIPLPHKNTQKFIGDIYMEFEKKIDLNRRTNETLEAMARALFRDWFVDFGPTRAKMAGQAPYLTPEIWELFPDRLDDEGKPEGWDDSLVGRQFDVTMGQSPPGDTYNPDGIGIPFYQGKTDFGAVFPQRRMYCTAPTRFANTLDSLVSVRAPVGDVNLSEEKCCIGRGLASVRHPQNLPYYTYFTMKFLRDVFSSFESNGTVFGSINKKQFEELSVIESGFEKLFERQVMPTCSKIVANETENRNLAQLRDLLLPKLMSGEIRIRDAKKMVADAL